MSSMLQETLSETPFNSPVITHEKCAKCKDILDAHELPADHDGMIATYDDNRYCTLACFKTEQEQQ